MSTTLLLEDDETFNKNISLVLESEGYKVIRTYNVHDAEKSADLADLLVLDVMLGDENGMELCRRLRKRIKTPIIFLTSCDDEADIVEGLDIGGDDYITKPFRLRELLSRIRANLRRSPETPKASELLEAELTAVESKLLDYLISNRGHYLTREQILDYLWDCKGIFVNDNTLSVNISRLREKLKKFGQIVTKRGLGYKWTDQTNL